LRNSSRRDEVFARPESFRCGCRTAPRLRTDVFHTREVELATAEDVDILQWCREQARILITLDADCHALLALSGATSPSVVRIRIEGLRDRR